MTFQFIIPIHKNHRHDFSLAEINDYYKYYIKGEERYIKSRSYLKTGTNNTLLTEEQSLLNRPTKAGRSEKIYFVQLLI